MRRRTFISLLSGAAAWPLAARAQQRERIRRIATLTGIAKVPVIALELVGRQVAVIVANTPGVLALKAATLPPAVLLTLSRA
jgi:hypothetical protein